MLNPNMTYEELQKQVKYVLAEMYILGSNAPTNKGREKYTKSFTKAEEDEAGKLIQLFATLCAEVIGQDENSGVTMQSNGKLGPFTDEHLRNHLRAKQRIILAQLTTKNTEGEK